MVLQMGQRLAGEGLEIGIVAVPAVALEQRHGILVGRDLHVVVRLGELLAVQRAVFASVILKEQSKKKC